MTEFWIKAAQLILSLTILVTLHELGHFIPARLFGTRVKKFYLFFDFLFPFPNVMNFSLFKIKRGDTEYGIGWFPMGGYVQIDGMVDESMDTEALKEPPKPWEFRAKPAWQRLIIMVGGVVVNLILGFFIYSMVLFFWGKEKLPLSNLEYGVYVDSTLMDAGLMDGDKIIAIDGNRDLFLSDVGKEILINGKRTITVLRNGEELNITLPEDIHRELLDKRVKQLIAPRFPFEVDSVFSDSPAAAAGLRPGDRIVAVGGTPTPDVKTGVNAIRSHKGESTTLVVVRAGDTLAMDVAVREDGTIGFVIAPITKFIEPVTYRYSFIEAIPAGFVETVNITKNYVASLKLIFTKEGASQLGGFGAIGNMFAPVWDWQSFWTMTAFLSLILAVMNILPIPALDGGHVLFILYEMITGRKPGDKFLEYAQTLGMILLLLLLVFANANDLLRMFGK
ncbi:MAG: RIP metalloprotease RseP [Salibacteraceae bacterium]